MPICQKCLKEFEHKTRGRKPKICPICKEGKKESKEYTCTICGKSFEHNKKGRIPKICKDCRKNKPQKTKKEQKPKVEKKPRIFVCAICKKTFEHNKRGKMPRVCATCKTPVKSNKTIVCENCGEKFEHNKKGRKPKYCKNCKGTVKKKEEKAPVVIKKARKKRQFYGIYSLKTGKKIKLSTFSNPQRAENLAALMDINEPYEIKEVKENANN